MKNSPELDLSSYTPVNELSHYAHKHITPKGSVKDIVVLSRDAKSFITGLGVDVALWNGSKGTFGRFFQPSRENSKPVEFSVDKIKQMRSTYIDLKRSTYVDTSRCQLRRELVAQTKIQSQLNKSVLEIQEKITKVRDKMLAANHPSKPSSTHQPLFKLLKKLESDLASSKRATDAIAKKVSQTESDIAETDYAFLRRYALLWCIFKSTSPHTLRKCAYSSNTELLSRASSAKKESEIVWRRTLQVKSCYIDAKSGLTHLYKIESTLKAILEHLEAADNSLNGLPSSSASSLPSAVSVDYRLSYVKKLWISVEPEFQQAKPYLQLLRLSMGQTGGEVSVHKTGTITEIFDKGGGTGTVTSIFQDQGNYGTFAEKHELMSKYEDIEVLHPLNRTKRIAALHKHARAVYKFMNVVYDSQEELVDQAMGELRRMEEEDITASENLVSLWENLLAISTENM